METNLSLTVSIKFHFIIIKSDANCFVLDDNQAPTMGRPLVDEHQEEVKGGQLIDTNDRGNKVFEAMVGPDRYATAQGAAGQDPTEAEYEDDDEVPD